MDITNLQQQLPAGLQVDAVLQQSAVFGQLFRLFDRRLDEQAPIERRLRVFEFGDIAWRAALIKQVRGLCGINSPRLLRPLEAGVLTSGAIYLIEDVLPTSVENQLPPDGKSLRAETAWSWIEQILDGLDELHAAGLSHGTWRLDSLLLDTHPVDASTKAVLGDAVGGIVPLISQGGILVDGVSDYFPPEWNGVLKPPSPQADVYALGLLACEMLLGRAVVRNVKAQQIAPARVRELLLAKVGNKGLSRSRCEVLRRMLEPNPKLRPAHARAVRKGRKPFLRLVPALAVTAGVLFITAIGIGIGWSQHVGNLTNQNDALKKQIETERRATQQAKDETQQEKSGASQIRSQKDSVVFNLKEKNIELIAADKLIADQKAEIVELKKRVPTADRTVSQETPLEAAKKLWAKLPNHRFSVSLVDVEKVDCKPNERTYLTQWTREVDQAWRGINHSFTKDQLKPKADKTRRERAYDALKREPWRHDLKDEIVQAFWNDFLPSPSAPILFQVQTIISKVAKTPTDTWLRKQLDQYAKPINGNINAWNPWLSSHQKHDLVEPFHQWVKEPWKTGSAKNAADRLSALESAARIWRKFAFETNDSWENFKDKVGRAAKVEGAAVEHIANSWIISFESRSNWELSLIQGTAPAGYGQHRIARLTVDGKATVLDERDWPIETRYDYGAAQAQSVKVAWRPGQKILIGLDGARFITRAGYRPEIFSVSFGGPVAMWWLSRNGKARGEDGGSLTFEIECPGPP